jgi:hypothetical protein
MSGCSTEKKPLVVEQVDLVSVFEKDGKVCVYTLAAGGGEAVVKLSPRMAARLLGALADWFAQAHDADA